jgi:hypothetical protein
MGKLSHFDEQGASRMVDVGNQPIVGRQTDRIDPNAASLDGPATAEELAILREGMSKWEAEQKQRAEKEARRFPTTIAGTRRFDLATFLIASTVFAFLVAAMRWAGFPSAPTLYFAGLIPFVGIAQAILFKGRRPQWAAGIGGTAYTVVLAILLNTSGNWLGIVVSAAIPGAAFGMLAGALVNGVFLLLSLLRRPRLAPFKPNDEQLRSDTLVRHDDASTEFGRMNGRTTA